MVRVTFAVYFGNIQTIFIIILALDVVVNVSKGAKIRNRYNQVTYLTQDTNEKVTNSQLDTANESQEVSPPGTNKQMHTKAQQTQDRKNTTDPQKEHRPGTASNTSYWRAQTSPMAPTPSPNQTRIKTPRHPACMKDP